MLASPVHVARAVFGLGIDVVRAGVLTSAITLVRPPP